MTRRFFVNTVFDLSRKQNVFFWLGQVVVILSTVVGVYLAASAGLRTAVEFHMATTVEKKYYTLSALREEVMTNNDLVKTFVSDNFNRDENGKLSSHKSMRLPTLNKFVWLTMSNSTETLELPVDILSDVNRYYISLDDLMTKYSQARGRDTLYLGSKLDTFSNDLDATLLKRIDSQLASYQRLLQPYKHLGDY